MSKSAPAEMADLSTEEKIGRTFFIGLPSGELTSEALDLLHQIRPGGVCLFARNILDRRQTRELLDQISETLGYTPLLSLDQEGGRVDRLRRIITPMPAPSDLRDPGDAKRFGRIVGETIALLGFNMDFAPVVDIADSQRSAAQNGLTSRTFMGTPDRVVEFASAFLDGLAEFGTLGCLKHFPGLGGARVDSHESLPSVDIDAATFRGVDLTPFAAILPQRPEVSVMIAHASYPRLGLHETTPNGKILPSSLNSSFVSTILRDELGFEGVAITDDLEMGAVMNEFGIGEACELAIRAGEDMLAICASPASIRGGFEHLRTAVADGRIPLSRIQSSVARIETLRTRVEERPSFDDGRLDELSQEIGDLKNDLSAG